MHNRFAHWQACALGALILSNLTTGQARAGDMIVYDPAPSWVDVARVEAQSAQPDALIVLLDQQARIENGKLWTYVDTAVALKSPEALTRFGTVTATWMPDKGDLIVHRVELIRAGEIIDLLATGAEFEVLRRESRLESRSLDGALTATLATPGAKLGDVLRLAYSITVSDQAMGDNVQWQSGLIAKPFPLQQGRVSVSWPENLPVSRQKFGKVEAPEPTLRDGFLVWSASLPVSEAAEMPSDAPLRYQLGDIMQVSTFADWAAVSRNHAGHYDTVGKVRPGSALAARIARIAAASPDPLTRAALALRLVQDDVSYLANGMNGGNYIPQVPEETWNKRFGDCKAKTLLLLTILRELGVEAEAALVRTQGGDALPQLAPMPGNFDHVIVRAVIGGTNYWLDGTTAGTRIETIDQVPRFFHALPLREEGASLMPLDVRKPNAPDQRVRLTLDNRAGLRVPSIFDLEVEFRGTAGAYWRSMAEQGNKETLEEAAYGIANQYLGDTLLIDHALRYDADAGVALVSAKGLRTTGWNRDGRTYTLDPPAQVARNVNFDADRTRAAWRTIPLRLNGPIYLTTELEVLLPSDAEKFNLEGIPDLAAMIGGVELESHSKLDAGRLSVTQMMRSFELELAAEEIGVARREFTRFDRQLPVLRASGNIRELWQYSGQDRTRLAPLEALYAKAVVDADPDDPTALANRASYFAGIFDHSSALADVEAALAIEDSRDLYVFRSGLRRELGDLEGALADLVEAETLQPDGSTYGTQIELLAMLNRASEGLLLAEDFEGFTKDRVSSAEVKANALGWLGEADQGLRALEELVAQRPDDGNLLNALCWHAGIWSRMDEARLAICTQAVEKSDYAAAALDSRALAHLRLGNLSAAKADIDAALSTDPGLANSRLLRGIILHRMGDVSGKGEVALALSMRPSLAPVYKAWGLQL